MDAIPQTPTQRATSREARIKAHQSANENAALLTQQQASVVVAQQKQAAKKTAAAMLLAQQQAAALAAHHQRAPAATLLTQQQATSLVAQHQAAVLASQQQLAAAQAALIATTPTVPTGQPRTQNITFANTAGFALNPAMANQGILDYTTMVGSKVYETATRALSTLGYDCDPNGLYQ